MGRMTSPATDETPRSRLDRLMGARRTELRLLWKDVAGRAGLTTEGLRNIRFGTGDIRPLTKRGIEDALLWEAGSVTAILEGGDPAPAFTSPVEERLSAALRDHVAEEDEFDRLDRLYEEWKRDPTRGPVLRELLETWGERDAG